MLRSEQINEVVAALAKAQAAMEGAKKSGKNPSLHNEYSTLEDIINAVRKPFADNGLAFSQLLDTTADGVFLETILFHSSGQFIGSRLIVNEVKGNRAVNEMQTFGIAITYTKRYALAALAGIASEDDTDGNGATASNPARHRAQRQAPTEPPDLWEDPPNAPRPQEFKQQASMVDGVNEPFINVQFIGRNDTKSGKPRIGFWAVDDKWPKVHVWSREQALEVAPAIGLFYTKEELGGTEKLPFCCKLYHDGGKFPSPTRAEFGIEHRRQMATVLTQKAIQLGVRDRLAAYEDIPDDTWLSAAADVIRNA